MSEYVMWQINGERHRELLKVAQAHRLTRSPGPSPMERFTVQLGDWLVVMGTWLKARHQPVVAESPSCAPADVRSREVGLLL